MLDESEIFELYQLLIRYCTVDCIFGIYTDLIDLLITYWQSDNETLNCIICIIVSKTGCYLPMLVVIRSSLFVPMFCMNINEMVA